MIKRINHIRMTSIKHFIAYAIILLIINIFSYIQFITGPISPNFYLWLLYSFQDLFTALLAYPILYLIVINAQLSFSLNNYPVLMRLKNRKSLFFSDIRIIFKTTIIFMCLVLLTTSIVGLLAGFDFENQWSTELTKAFVRTIHFQPNRDISLIMQTLIEVIFYFTYLLFLGSWYNLFLVCFKKAGISFTILFSLVIFQTYFYTNSINSFFARLWPINYFIIYLVRSTNNNDFIPIKKSLFYWSILLGVGYIALYKRYQRANLGD